jgi:N-acetylneuraminic acid mutarotase
MLFDSLEKRLLACLAHEGIGPLPHVDPPAIVVPAENLPPPRVKPTNSHSSLNWTRSINMPQAREEGASAVLNNKLYAFGGFFDSTFNPTTRSDRFDPVKNQWKQVRSMPEAITHAPTIVINNEAWLFGGYVGKDPGPATAKVYVYNPISDTWRRGPDMPAARGAAAAARVGDFVYVFGGRNLNRIAEVAQAFALHIPSGTWSTRANMPNPRNHLAGVAVGGLVYAVGGQLNEASNAINQRTVSRYNPASDTWTAAADLPFARSHNVASTFSFKGRIVVAGGETAHNIASGKVLLYEPWNDSWRSLRDLPDIRRAPQAGIINGKLYVAGGSIRGGQRGDLFVSSTLDAIL